MAEKKKDEIRSFIFLLGILLLILCTVWGGKKYIKWKSSIPESNKSLPRSQSFVNDNTQLYTDLKVFHLSFDDTINIFKDITDNENKYLSIFENPMLGWLKSLHQETGVKVSCYVFFSDGAFSLSQCTTKFKSEFESNCDWLRFGFHSEFPEKKYNEGNENDIIEDYNRVINCLLEIVGHNSIDNMVRLEGFQGTCQGMKMLGENSIEPIVGLYGPDDGRKSYYLDTDESDYLYCHDIYYDNETGLLFVSTDLRTEYIIGTRNKIREFQTDAWNNQLDIFEVFSHEWVISNYNKYKIRKLCNWANKNGYKFEFLEDKLQK